jgi:hypothetical protein
MNATGNTTARSAWQSNLYDTGMTVEFSLGVA